MKYLIISNILLFIVSILALVLVAVKRCRVIDMTDPENAQEVIDIKSKMLSK